MILAIITLTIQACSVCDYREVEEDTLSAIYQVAMTASNGNISLDAPGVQNSIAIYLKNGKPTSRVNDITALGEISRTDGCTYRFNVGLDPAEIQRLLLELDEQVKELDGDEFMPGRTISTPVTLIIFPSDSEESSCEIGQSSWLEYSLIVDLKITEFQSQQKNSSEQVFESLDDVQYFIMRATASAFFENTIAGDVEYNIDFKLSVIRRITQSFHEGCG